MSWAAWLQCAFGPCSCAHCCFFWARQVRNQFLKAGVGIQEADDVRELLAQVKEPLLPVVRQSRDFDPKAAEQLILELEKVNPYRSDAPFLRSVGFANMKRER